MVFDVASHGPTKIMRAIADLIISVIVVVENVSFALTAFLRPAVFDVRCVCESQSLAHGVSMSARKDYKDGRVLQYDGRPSY